MDTGTWLLIWAAAIIFIVLSLSLYGAHRETVQRKRITERQREYIDHLLSDLQILEKENIEILNERDIAIGGNHRNIELLQASLRAEMEKHKDYERWKKEYNEFLEINRKRLAFIMEKYSWEYRKWQETYKPNKL